MDQQDLDRAVQGRLERERRRSRAQLDAVRTEHARVAAQLAAERRQHRETIAELEAARQQLDELHAVHTMEVARLQLQLTRAEARGWWPWRAPAGGPDHAP